MRQNLNILDSFDEVSNCPSWQDKLSRCRTLLNQQEPGLDRIGIALYDSTIDTLRTFMSSPLEESPLTNYDFPLEEAESLASCVHAQQPRLVNDLSLFENGGHLHTRKISESGFQSSFTLPVFDQKQLLGVIFFNSRQKNYFREMVLERVKLTGHLLGQMIVNYTNQMHAMLAAVHTAIGMVDYRDPETGNHLKRMASFSRLIACDLVAKGRHALNDEEIDQIYRFAPMHDVGKIGIPDQVLLKPDRLDADEWETMKQHATIGGQIIAQLIENFRFGQLPFIDYLRQTTELHHEKMDGSGYPYGLESDEVPLVARIVAVSDIFDALTSERPYKPAWSNQDARAELRREAGQGRLDPDCVASLLDNWDEVLAIQQRFADA